MNVNFEVDELSAGGIDNTRPIKGVNFFNANSMSFHQVDHHFVALVEVEGGVWELDGRRKGGAKLVGNVFSGPQFWQHFSGQNFWQHIILFKVGKCQDGEFLGKAAAVCKEYMARDPTSLSFTVLALTASD